MRQLAYTMFISNICALFHLWWKENLVKHQKVSKYENNCRKKRFFMTWFPSLHYISNIASYYVLSIFTNLFATVVFSLFLRNYLENYKGFTTNLIDSSACILIKNKTTSKKKLAKLLNDFMEGTIKRYCAK